MEAANNIGMISLMLLILVLIPVVWYSIALKLGRGFRELYSVACGRVPASQIAKNRIVWLLVIGTLAALVVRPAFDRMERKSPMHLVVKPYAEAKVSSNGDARKLLGSPMSFGDEESWSYGSESGDMSFPVNGSTTKGSVHVAAKVVAGLWQPMSIDLKVDDRSVAIPVH